jgi:Flp pilus assembly protein TadB
LVAAYALLVSGERSERHRRIRFTPLGWLIAALIVVFGLAGLVTGSVTPWIVGLVVLAVVLLLAVGQPRNVHDLNVPPGMPNAPGDPTSHEHEDER